jgi:hypothetical protein
MGESAVVSSKLLLNPVFLTDDAYLQVPFAQPPPF